MLKSIAVLGVLGLVLLGGSAPLAAQARSTVSSADLESAVITAPGTDEATVQRFLQDDRVIEAATSMGVRASDLAAGVQTLDASALHQVAERTRASDRQLAGGNQTVVISTTAIIIGLLILILLVK